jgi:type VI protein secretion system component VasK
MRRGTMWSVVVAAVVLAAPRVAEAYIGPGAGLTAIGTVIAFLGAIALAIVGFVWYPIKRLRAKISARRTTHKRDKEAASRSS